jgi:hypothetical protein
MRKITVENRVPCRILVAVATLTLAFSVAAEGSVLVKPGDNIQSLVNSYPSGTVFSLAAGTYVRQSIVPKSGDSFIGESGAVLNGSTTVTGFTSDGPYWVASFHIAPVSAHGTCLSSHPACIYPEDLFVDGTMYTRVTSLSNVTSGHWYLSYSAGKVYVGNNPAGHTVQISTARYAFYGVGASNVTIQGLTIEMYGNPAQTGAIEASQYWTIEQNTVCYNHGAAIEASSGTHIVDNRLCYNGQEGIGANGSGLLVEGNQIDHNNTAGYLWGWEAGGAKFCYTTGLVVEENYVHDNIGAGLHTDIENSNTLYENNTTANNVVAGILHEISGSAVIRDNTSTNDGFTPQGTGLGYGGAIMVNSSNDVEIYGNTVTNGMNGIIGWQADRGSNLLEKFYVHNNIITQTNGGTAAGIGTIAGNNAVFTSWGNRYVQNTYILRSLGASDFAWQNRDPDVAGWRADGEDTTGTFRVR